MPIIKSAKKAARQSVKRRSKNATIKKSIRNALKAFRNNPSSQTMATAQSEYDKAVKKGLIKKNTASRRKANLAKYAKAHDVKVDGEKKAAEAKKSTKASTAKVAETKKATETKKTAGAKKAAGTKKTAGAKKATSAKKAE